MQSEKKLFPKIEKAEKFLENEKEKVLRKEKILSTFLCGKAKELAQVFALISVLTLGYEPRAEAPVEKEKTARKILSKNL